MDEKTTYFGNKVIPEDEKKGRVKEVFDSVADRYDLMNDLMSMGTHRLWKRLIASESALRPGQKAIDVAGGTADISILMADRVGEAGEVVVYDINGEMLKMGKRKCVDRGYIKNIRFVQGNAEDISFDDNSFHCATVGFGIRNVTHLKKALKEMVRVVKPGGKIICLEFSHPESRVLSKLYDFYSFSVIPRVGEMVTGNRDAYVYLPESIRKFPKQEELKAIFEELGLFKARYINLFNGIAAMHTGIKV